jgi:hypothetical protein
MAIFFLAKVELFDASGVRQLVGSMYAAKDHIFNESDLLAQKTCWENLHNDSDALS